MNYYKLIPWIALILSGLLITGCQGESNTVNLQPSSQDAESTSEAADYEDEIEISMEVGPGPFIFVERTAGLDELDSYMATLVISFDGLVNGETALWSKTYAMTRTRNPLFRLLSITPDGDTPISDPVVFAETEGTSYRADIFSCIASPIESDSEDVRFGIDELEPAALLHGVYGAEEGGQVLLGDVMSDYYTFDQRALVEQGISSANGEIWIASDGGYLVKYELTFTGTEEYFGEGIEGTVTWDYEISQVNTVQPPILPDSCRINAPLLADAFNVINQPNWLAFDTASSVVDAAAFYQERISSLGWSERVAPTISETDAFLIYVQEDQILSISIYSTENQVTRVSLVRDEIAE